MSEDNGKASGNRDRPILVRAALIALVAAAVFIVGHCGFSAFHEPAYAAAGPMQFGPSPRRGAADVPAPPRSERAFAMPSPGGSGRILAEYASQDSPEEILRFYRAAMPRLGWTEHKPLGNTYSEGGLTVLWYSNSAEDSCTIAVSMQPAAQTMVTVIRMTPGGSGK